MAPQFRMIRRHLPPVLRQPQSLTMQSFSLAPHNRLLVKLDTASVNRHSNCPVDQHIKTNFCPWVLTWPLEFNINSELCKFYCKMKIYCLDIRVLLTCKSEGDNVPFAAGMHVTKVTLDQGSSKTSSGLCVICITAEYFNAIWRGQYCLGVPRWC
jgi:hypothetical protein